MIIILIILNGFLPNFYYLEFSVLLLFFVLNVGIVKKLSGISADKLLRHYVILIKALKAIIIIIIKKDWQCKAGRGRLTPYQSEAPAPLYQLIEEKNRKGK